jgi:hypothetical protein
MHQGQIGTSSWSGEEAVAIRSRPASGRQIPHTMTMCRQILLGALQRRQAEQVYQKAIQQLQDDLKKAQTDAEYYLKEAETGKTGRASAWSGSDATEARRSSLCNVKWLV